MSTFSLDYSRWVDDEPKPLAAGALTVAVHVAFAAVLFLNMSWQDKIQPHASVKLWESMPTTAKKSVTRSKPKPVKKKVTAKPTPAVEPKTAAATRSAAPRSPACTEARRGVYADNTGRKAEPTPPAAEYRDLRRQSLRRQRRPQRHREQISPHRNEIEKSSLPPRKPRALPSNNHHRRLHQQCLSNNQLRAWK